MPEPDIRRSAEIQRAHDMLVGIILTEVPEIEPTDQIVHYAEVLCWILHHDHNQRFQDFLRMIETKLASLGIEIVEDACPADPKTVH